MQIGKKLLRTGKMRRSFHTVRGLMIAAALGGASLAAGASPVTYTFAGTFSGSLGTTSFTDVAGVFTLTGDTSYVQTPDNAFFYNTAGPSTFQLGSNTPVTFMGGTLGVESEYGAATFMDAMTGFAVGEYNEMTSYFVLSVAGSTSGDFISYGANPELTSGGNLIISGATGDVTFQTSIPSDTTPIPEPPSLQLAATGLAGVAIRLRRKRHSA